MKWLELLMDEPESFEFELTPVNYKLETCHVTLAVLDRVLFRGKEFPLFGPERQAVLDSVGLMHTCDSGAHLWQCLVTIGDTTEPDSTIDVISSIAFRRASTIRPSRICDRHWPQIIRSGWDDGLPKIYN